MKYKYNIYWLLQELPHKDHTDAKIWLAEKCGMGKRGFEKWMYAYPENSLEIPFSCLLLMADFFGVDVAQMICTEKPTGTKQEFKASLKTT